MQVQLIVVNEEHKGKTIPINTPAFIIGRAAGCNLRLYKPMVSRFHCSLQLIDGTLMVQDLGGENGTYVNGNRVTIAYPLKHGDKLFIGEYCFSVDVDVTADKPLQDEFDFFELSPSAISLKSEDTATISVTPMVSPVTLSVADDSDADVADAESSEIMFGVRLAGQRVTVTKSQLFALAQRGHLSPNDFVVVSGTTVFADSIQGIVFGRR